MVSLGYFYLTIQSYMAKDSKWIINLTVLSFMVSCFYTAKVYERKRRDLFIVCQNSPFNMKVASALRDNVGDYQPPWWYNRHFGTMIPFGYNPNLTYEREIFTVEDACFAVDWFPRKPVQQTSSSTALKICVFYPGLGLGSQNVRLLLMQYLTCPVNTSSFLTQWNPIISMVSEICTAVCTGNVAARILLCNSDFKRCRYSSENITV